MKFIKEFFILNLNDYENIPFYFPIGLLITLLTLAMCIAVFVIAFRNRFVSETLKQLIRHDALNEKSAKTLKELRLDRLLGLKTALSTSGQLTYLVKRVGQAKMSYEDFMSLPKKNRYKSEKIDFDAAQFYIAPEQLDRARTTLDKTSGSILKPVIIAAILIVAWLFLALFLPDLLAYINSSLV